MCPSGTHVFIYVDLFVHSCVWVSVCMCFVMCMCVCMCVCVCVCVDGAFVTKHPRCQRDTVGWWSKGWGPREEVFLYCCTAVETVAPSLSLSYSRLFSGNLQQAGSRNSEWYFSTRREWRRGGRRGGEEGRGGGALFPHAPLPPPPSACAALMSPAELNTVDCWEVKGEEEEGGEGDECIRAPWPLVPRALDPGKSASSVFFDPASGAAQWIHCQVNMCISILWVRCMLVVHYRREIHKVTLYVMVLLYLCNQ